MTEEQQDIEQEQKKEKPKKNKLNILIDCAFFIILFFIVSLFSAFPMPDGCAQMLKPSPEGVAQSLLQSLQSAAAIYVAQERIPPVIFSDFVETKGNATESHTITIDNIDAVPEFINPKEMKLAFEAGGYSIYYLDGTDITASYNFEIPKDKNINKSKKQEESDKFAFLTRVFILTTILFLILKLLSCCCLGRVLMYIIIVVILGSVYVPKFTKPAIYLYPKKPTEVNITLDKRIDLTLDVPKYVTNKGWHVMAYPNGKIIDLQPEHTNCKDLDLKIFGLEYAKEACLNNNYPYIYWEGNSFKKDLPPQTNGWVVKTSDVKEFLNTKLNYVGFNKAEKDEFIRYWVHKIREENQETVFISFMQTEMINDYFPMIVTPKPDSINRFYIVVDLNVDKHKASNPQELEKFSREDFTLVDWGGCLVE